MQTSLMFPELVDLDPVLTEIFYQQYDLVASTKGAVFGMRNSTKSKETDQNIGSFSDPPIFDGTVEYETARPDFPAEYIHEEYAKGFIVERKLLDDMQYEGIFDSATDLGVAFARKMEKDAWSVFNNAFTGVTGYDGKTLCANDHPRSKSDTTAVDNSLALALNSDNLETARTTMKSFGDDRGEQISLLPNLLIVPTALRKIAFELTESEWTPGDANTAANVHRGMQFLEVEYLDDSNAWFVVDTLRSQRWLKWYDRIPVEFAAVSDFDTLVRKYRAYMRYSFGWSNFRFVVGSNPS